VNKLEGYPAIPESYVNANSGQCHEMKPEQTLKQEAKETEP
jgi:hypothetical protein